MHVVKITLLGYYNDGQLYIMAIKYEGTCIRKFGIMDKNISKLMSFFKNELMG